MAPLVEHKFTVKFDNGVDTNTDPKTVIPSKFTKLDNMEWAKSTSVSQRPGYTAQTIAPIGLAGSLAGCRQLHDLGAELVLEAASGFVAYAQGCIASRDAASGFSIAGFSYPKVLERARVDVVDVTASVSNQHSPDATAASPSGVECWVWTEVSNLNSTTNTFYRVIDGATRTILKEGPLHPSTTDLSYNARVIVRNVAGASRFYIYYSTSLAGPLSEIRMRTLDIAVGATVTGALSAETVMATGMTRVIVPFDAWYEPLSDKIIFSYEDAAGDLVIKVYSGSNGTTQLVSITEAKTLINDISVTATYTGGVATAVVTYIDVVGVTSLVSVYSMLMSGASALNTVVTSGANGNATRVSSVASTYGYLLVFYNTAVTGLPDCFNNNIGFVRCDPDGANPAVQSIFARGVSLASRPCEYVNARADELVYRYCVGAVLRSELQPTMFLLSAGSADNLFLGYGTIADTKHSSPRVLARLKPGQCGNPYRNVPSTDSVFFRFPTNMPVI